jgi:outer membrane protein assembly factor BamB
MPLRHHAFGFLAALALLTLPATAADFSQFRGPAGDGHAIAAGLPVNWNSTDHVTWQVPVAGKGWSSPIVVGNRLFLTTAVAKTGGGQDDQSLRALCLDLKSGKTVWDQEVFSGNHVSTEGLLHSKNSHASPTPISDGKRLYVHFGTEGTAALELDTGRIAWKMQDLAYVPRHGSGGSPALVDGLLVVTCDGQDVDYVAAINTQNGKIAWKTDRTLELPRKFSFSTPLVIEVEGRKQIVCPGTGLVAAYEPKTGKEIWRVLYGDGYSVIPRPVFGHGLVFVCSGWGVPTLFAIRPTGTGDVTETHVAWKQTSKANVPHTPSVLLIKDDLFLISDTGIASSLDARTGKLHYRKRIGGRYSASPTFADGKIYIQSEAGRGFVLKPGREFVELGRNQLEGRTFASYAVADNALFIRTENRLFRIEK